jgi:hypothetical protein
MNKHIYLYIFFILTIHNLTGCVSQKTGLNSIDQLPQFLNEVEVPSLNVYYPLISQEALKWDSNVQTDDVYLDLSHSEDPKRRIILYVFNSPDNSNERLYMEVFKDGTIKSQIEQYGFTRRAFTNIKISELLLDSKDAWNGFLGIPEVVSSDRELFECALLNLSSRIIKGEEYIVWKLILRDCENKYLVIYSIDAISGTLLEIDRR